MDIQLELFAQGAYPQAEMRIRGRSADNFDGYMLSALEKQSESITLESYKLTPEAFVARMQDFLNNQPRLFYVDKYFTIYTSKKTGYVTRIKPIYLFTGSDLTRRLADFDASVQKVVQHATSADTMLGQVLLVNDYFCLNFEYDDTLSIFRPDQLFSGGTGVCQAYMLAFSAVMDELDIPNTHATSNNMAHTWNMVNLDGSWYHVDATWNDPGDENPMQAHHRYFLLSDEGIQAQGHYDWTSGVTAGNKKYDSFFWQQIYTPLSVQHEDIVYSDPDVMDGTRTVHSWNTSSGKTTDLFSYDIFGKDHAYSYAHGMVPMCADEDHIYYSVGSRLYTAAKNGGDCVPVYDTFDDDMQIWSCWRNGNSLNLLLGASPYSDTALASCETSDRLTLVISPIINEIQPGQSAALTGGFLSSVTAPYDWKSLNEDAVTIDENGVLSAVAPGSALVQISCKDEFIATAVVIVGEAHEMKLPAALQSIGSEAFAGSAVQILRVPEGIESIGDRAFSDSPGLALVQLPDSMLSIAEDAFEASPNVALMCSDDSFAAEYAAGHGLPVIPVQP